MSTNKQAILYIDDTGVVGAGSWVPVPLTIDTDETSEWETVVEKCRGEAINSESPTDLSIALSGTIKFRKGSAILQRFTDAHLNANDPATGQLGVWNCTGDNTVIGNEGWRFNALVKTHGRPMPDGDYVKYAVSMAPHAENTDSAVPEFARVTV